MDKSRIDTIPNGLYPEWTRSRMDTIMNEHNPDSTSQMYPILNGQYPEKRHYRELGIILNGHHLELHNSKCTTSRMDTYRMETLPKVTISNKFFFE